MAVVWNGDRYSAQVTSSADEGVTAAAERLLALAIPRTPVMDGILRESGAVHPAGSAGKNTAAVTFDTPYAVIQHERMDYAHDEGGPKYLEGPLEENRDELVQIIAEHIRKGAS